MKNTSENKLAIKSGGNGFHQLFSEVGKLGSGRGPTMMQHEVGNEQAIGKPASTD